jgi:NADH:ubiquinone reductase (H+-translocating)
MKLGQTRILIVGGGFGGVYAAMALEKLLKGHESVHVGLISENNYLVFQPLLPEVISGSIGIVDTIAPIRKLCPNTDLCTREVESISLKNKTVTTSAGFLPRVSLLEYDHLVLAVGNVTSFSGQPGLAEHALSFKYLNDAFILRNRVIHCLEEATFESDPELRRALLTFVVAGGGFSGVEVVAELNDFLREGSRSFRRIAPEEIQVVLLHAGSLILPEIPESLARYAQTLLQRRGIQVRLDTRLVGATADAAILEGGGRIPTKTLVSTVPAAPNPIISTLPCKKERGRIVVNKYLEVLDYPGVWAVGDCAWILDRNTWQPCPPTAQHATRQADCVAKNIVQSLRGRPKQVFTFKTLGRLAALGHRSAVAEVFGFKLSGFVAWLLWRSIYLMKMPGLDRKLRVASDWLLDLLLPPDIVQLKFQRSPGLCREHFLSHETIFREGDRGDRLYFVVDGEVEMIKEGSGGKQLLGRLGPGECFGEMALVNDDPRIATARTATEVNVLSMDRQMFTELFAKYPPLRRVFEDLIYERLGGRAG